jgi:hypothetical protein
MHSAGPGPAQDYGPRGQRPATTVPGQPLGLGPVGSAHWPKRPDQPARRGAITVPTSAPGRHGGAVGTT